MVRFKLERRGRARMENEKFQFHDGSIQAWNTDEGRALVDKVSIPRWFDSSFHGCSKLGLCVCGFNSTMVRFKPRDALLAAGYETSFNSTMVRFKHGVFESARIYL